MPTLCGYDLGYRGCLIEVYGSRAERSNARRAGYAVVMLFVASVGSVAGVLALFVSR
jgi:hypothetical protein